MAGEQLEEDDAATMAKQATTVDAAAVRQYQWYEACKTAGGSSVRQ